MNILKKFIKEKLITSLITTAIYVLALFVLIYIYNGNSIIYYPIDPYVYGSSPVDFFLPLLVTIPFSFYSYHIVKNGFIDYAGVRISKKKYITYYILSSLISCFVMVFVANLLAIVFSVNIASISQEFSKPSYDGFLLGNLQMNSPLIFGIIWSLYKAFVATLICLFGQVISLYSGNLFLVLLGPFIYSVLENFITGVLRIPQFSFTTALILHRLDESFMNL
ncbi:hypothetical protein JNO63_03750 [Anaerococcus sp. mt242]|uniref:hypothetical protein n=1 Tax=Anaerococcus sp. mt242 TaxID=2661917 RepID=UPI001932875D|nr:hypothetical protein [Anaerococcus sp. mt242]MBM0046201.1 hypothetical protein [Anaerococcus sp. mt242]